jgi:hypothetical protein
MIPPLLLLLLISIVNHDREAAQAASLIGNYTWKARDQYYFPTLSSKVSTISLQGQCKPAVKLVDDQSTALPANDSDLLISTFPITKDIFQWWHRIPRPKQMRVDPYICDVVYTKKLPIFKNTGCQLAGYMSPSAPRCQTQYLKWICDSARIPINSSIANGFALPESDHHSNIDNPPPQPWLLTARNATVSMCGQILSTCGKSYAVVCALIYAVLQLYLLAIYFL